MYLLGKLFKRGQDPSEVEIDLEAGLSSPPAISGVSSTPPVDSLEHVRALLKTCEKLPDLITKKEISSKSGTYVNKSKTIQSKPGNGKEEGVEGEGEYEEKPLSYPNGNYMFGFDRPNIASEDAFLWMLKIRNGQIKGVESSQMNHQLELIYRMTSSFVIRGANCDLQYKNRSGFLLVVEK